MTITLTPELAALVEGQLKTGRYPSAEAVIGEALAKSAGGDSEAKADAMEEFLSRELDEILLSKDPHYPTVAEVQAKMLKNWGYLTLAKKVYEDDEVIAGL